MSDIKPSEITSETVYLSRRRFLRLAGATAAGAVILGACRQAGLEPSPPGESGPAPRSKAARDELGDKLTSFAAITNYNNFYEFSLDKEDVAALATGFATRPWTVKVGGLARRGKTYDVDDLLRRFGREERVYRLRCVEAWSMVIPWIGFPLADFIARCEPTSKAKFVQFFTLDDAAQMPGVRVPVLDWPYTEGLRMDEAMHPLTILAVGLYGEVLPNQNGAPIRLVVPWKYGFKGIKSIVRMRFVEQEPRSSWQISAPSEYGFYSNVNPSVDHPRWSQARENRLPGFLRNRPTLMFNGYADQVAQLYSGMDLRRNF